MLQRFLAEDLDITVSLMGQSNADADGDGDINASDATYLLRLLAGLDPIAEASAGKIDLKMICNVSAQKLIKMHLG